MMEFSPQDAAIFGMEIKSDSPTNAIKILGVPDAIKKSFIPEHFVNIGSCVT